jgi:hypothetical protein
MNARTKAALQTIAHLRGVQCSAMRDSELKAVEAVTDEGIQDVFESLSALLDIAEAAVQHAELNVQSKAWFGDEIEMLIRSKKKWS